MALNNTISTQYNFKRDYSTLPLMDVPLIARNAVFFEDDSPVLSAYAGLDTLNIYPVFDNTVTDIADDYRYFIDFGDGTLSDELTGQHTYSHPGDYMLTLVVCDSGTNFYKSTYQPIIRIRNVLDDSISMTYKNKAWSYESTIESPIIISRINSYQTYPTVSADGGYTINLSVSGNHSKYVTPDEYNSDPYMHLNAFATFVTVGDDGSFTPINSIKTSNTFIYARRDRLNPSLNALEFFPVPRDGTIFVGTSGTAEVYYYED